MGEPAFSISVIIFNLLSYIAGFLSAIFAEPIRRWLFRPELELQFDENSSDYIYRTPHSVVKTYSGTEGFHEAYHVRFKVTNIKRTIARSCRAYLVNIEKKNTGTGSFERTDYSDSLQLAWSNRDQSKAFEYIDLPKGIKQFVDVIVTTSWPGISKAFEPRTAFTPYRYEKLYQEHGVFRLTIQVSCEDIDPKFLKLIFQWNGQWNNFKVTKE